MLIGERLGQLREREIGEPLAQHPDALAGAQPGSVHDRLLAGEQLPGGEPMLVIDPPKCDDGCVLEVDLDGALDLPNARALNELAGDLGQGVPARERIVLHGQSLGTRQTRDRGPDDIPLRALNSQGGQILELREPVLI